MIEQQSRRLDERHMRFIEWEAELLILNIILLVSTIFNLLGFFYPDTKYFIMFIDFMILAFCVWEFLRTKFTKMRKLIGI
jgi:hypothetical protein